MYLVDDEDRVIELCDLPGHNAGAPEPVILATDLTLLVAYRTKGDTDDLVVLQFERVFAHYFGGPNDEALIGHPLAGRGLRLTARSRSSGRHGYVITTLARSARLGTSS
jgi:hypothetical protein